MGRDVLLCGPWIMLRQEKRPPHYRIRDAWQADSFLDIRDKIMYSQYGSGNVVYTLLVLFCEPRDSQFTWGKSHGYLTGKKCVRLSHFRNLRELRPNMFLAQNKSSITCWQSAAYLGHRRRDFEIKANVRTYASGDLSNIQTGPEDFVRDFTVLNTHLVSLTLQCL